MMSAAPRYPSDMGYAGLRMTADEYLALGETPERYELVEGVVVMMSPSPSFRHQEIIAQVLHQLLLWDPKRARVRAVPDTDVQMGPDLVYRPDVAVYLSSRLPAQPASLSIPPDLVIEVLSPGSKPFDLITKRDDYERFGVNEYWVVDPADGSVRCWRREQGRLVEKPVTGDSVSSSAIEGFALRLGALKALAG